MRALPSYAMGDFARSQGESRDAGAAIRLLGLDGRTVTLGTIAKRPSFGLAAAPDNGAILYTQFDSESNELMLLEPFR